MTLAWTKNGARGALVGMRDTKTGELKPLTVRDIVAFQGEFEWSRTDVPSFQVLAARPA